MKLNEGGMISTEAAQCKCPWRKYNLIWKLNDEKKLARQRRETKALQVEGTAWAKALSRDMAECPRGCGLSVLLEHGG